MYTLRPPFFYRMLSPGYLACSLPTAERVIYLTFDDGPDPDATPEILNILKAFHVKSTFFCTGKNVRSYQDIYNLIRDQGHEVGNQTYHHLNGWKCSAGAYLEDVRLCREVVDSNLFRPPYGRITLPQFILLRKEYRIILWSLLSADFDRKITPEQCLNNLERIDTGEIIVFHDSTETLGTLRAVLPPFLELLLSKGFRIKTVPAG